MVFECALRQNTDMLLSLILNLSLWLAGTSALLISSSFSTGGGSGIGNTGDSDHTD